MADRLSLPEIGELPTFRASAFCGLIVPEREWHVPGFMPCRDVTLLMANGGDGKSTIGVQLSISTVMGRTWFGRLCRAGPVLYLSAEDDRDELHRRLEAVVHAENLQFADLELTAVSWNLRRGRSRVEAMASHVNLRLLRQREAGHRLEPTTRVRVSWVAASR